MATYKVEVYRPEHLGRMKEVDPYLRKLAEVYQMGPAYTGLADDEVIVCAGIVQLWPGHGEAWAIFNGEAERHKIFIHRNVKRMLERLMCHFDRVETAVRADFREGMNWVRHLGFKEEGKMLMYYNKETYVRYARITANHAGFTAKE